MQIVRKDIPATIVLETTTVTTIPGIPDYVDRIIPRLLAEAADRGQAVTGPTIFTYTGCDGHPDTQFTMTISLPVDTTTGSGAFTCRTIPAHACLSTVCYGPSSVISATWSRFTPQAMSMQLPLQPVGREVYLHWVDRNSDANVTELQIPLQA